MFVGPQIIGLRIQISNWGMLLSFSRLHAQRHEEINAL